VSEASCEAPGPNYVLLAAGRDCDDDDIFTNPLGNEVCDDLDNDCDDLVDDDDDSLDPAFSDTFYIDDDRDGFGDPDEFVQSCARPAGYANNDRDCNDRRDTINPDAPEICDATDNDCDDLVDDADGDVDLGTAGTWYADLDSDGFGNPDLSVDACSQPAMYVDNDLDCDDTDEDKLVDGPWLVDNDGDGVGAGPPSAASCEPPNEVDNWAPSVFGTDCDNSDPTRYPGNVEICNNGNDEDCNGVDAPCDFARSERSLRLDAPGAARVLKPR
jgi:hypothetical protein